jgi:murein DD-endopeptidase MepM/ murein hydrolase activator NlpD
MPLTLRTACLVLLPLGILSMGVGTHDAIAQPGLNPAADTLTQSVLIHPPIDATGPRISLVTREHTYRSSLRLGDQLARDFMIQRVGSDGVPRAYEPETAGERNEDWYGWRSDVLAPFDGTVARVVHPDSVNVPGTMNRDGEPGLIVFRDESDGIVVIYVHVRDIEVQQGQTVDAGDLVAQVGNNATSRVPHVHVGAWRGDMDLLSAKQGGTPLQIQVDLYAQQRSQAGARTH